MALRAHVPIVVITLVQHQPRVVFLQRNSARNLRRPNEP